ncbi:putative integral membrane protein [Caenispirillum salinarum AK4]|uniref:Putative integral membrane protein n=1 Tax=Caenispirillum salinarum AK4 TaxID=1238182 RepID=K9GUL1_9PROT|nr:DUF2189 domain-containing protein [Caenispirillum salinarum]EKV29615.1 putative integral membrane protein [Caenispirillum salinarum AK4]
MNHVPQSHADENHQHHGSGEKDLRIAETNIPLPYHDRIRPVSTAQVWGWLRAGWADMRAAGWRSPAFGAVFVALGYAIWFGLASFGMLYLLTPMIAGFLLVAPSLAVGFYEMSHRMEQGRDPSFRSALFSFRHNTFHILTAGLVLMLFMMIWVRIAALIFAVSFPYTNMTGPALLSALGSADGIVFLTVGTVIGFGFAVVAFVFGAFSLPMMLDRRSDIFAGAIVSAQAVFKSPKAMVLWAGLIVAFTGIGLATAFLGLIVTLPLIGHATWHAYRDVVEWDDPPPPSSP